MKGTWAGLSIIFVLLLRSLWAGGNSWSAEYALAVETGPKTPFEGWGITLTPLDDGQEEYCPPEVLSLLCRTTGITLGRIVVGPNNYDGALHAVKRDVARDTFIQRIRGFRENGIQRYILAIESPPKALKQYFSISGDVQFVPNSLRNECEMEFAEYVANIVKCIVEDGLEPPLAISFSRAPESTDACVYAPDQWIRVLKLIRQKLDGKGFSETGIIGPEVATAAAISAFLPEYPRQNVAGLTALSVTSTDGSFDRTLGETFSGPLWITEPYASKAYSDPVLHAVGRLLVDLNDYHCRKWFWNYGFTYHRTSQSLVWGAARNSTELLRVLPIIWKAAPPGSYVMHAVLRSNDELTVDAHAVAFRNGNKITMFMLNPSDKKIRFIISGDIAITEVSYIYPTERKLVPVGSEWMEMSPKSVVELQGDWTRKD